MEDAEIIELFNRRSEEALRALDAKYGAACRRLAENITGSPEDAEECVNDAWLGVWNAIPPEKPDPLRTYVLRIVRNVSLKCLSRKNAAKRGGGHASALEELEGVLSGPDTAETAMEAGELAGLIEGFLDTLSAENRVIFLRRYWFSDPYGEIARRMGVSEKNVSVRLTRLRRKLKDYLTEREVFL